MWWREKVGARSRDQVWDVCGQLKLSSTDFSTRLSSQARGWEMMFSMIPCPQGCSIDCANERPWCQMWKLEATHHISPVAAAAVCRCEVDSGFQAKLLQVSLFSKAGHWAQWHSGCPETSDSQHFLKISSSSSQPWFPQFMGPKLCMLLIPSVKPFVLEISRVPSYQMPTVRGRYWG